MTPNQKAAAGLSAALVAAVAVKYRAPLRAGARKLFGGAPAASPSTLPAGPLSPRRQRILEAVASVLPAKYGAPGELGERFATLAPGYRPDDPKLPPGFTTCAYLPGFAGSKVSINTRYGLASIRDEAKKSNAWVEPSSGKLPRPGDFFVLGKDADTVSHVGVILDASGPTWTTADAGQGSPTEQEAKRVQRPWDPVAHTLGGPAGPRLLLGWMNVDAMPDPAAKLVA
jgi:hypothetical protein